MNDVSEITLSNLAPSRLLVKKQDLINLITPPTYVNLETQLFRETGVKPTLKDIKSYLQIWLRKPILLQTYVRMKLSWNQCFR